MNRAKLRAVRAAFFLTTVLCAAPALAQQPAAPAEDEAAASAAEIIVTGSRLPANGNAAPTPVTVAAMADLQQTTPSNISDALNKLPIFNGTGGQRSLNNSSGNSAGNYLNLRGIGINRNLVLFDGRRFPATTQNGVIDTNTIPQLLISRVEVVTGGASAVYGSDAVSGVVNYVVDRKFKGVKATGQAGISNYGDNKSQRFGIAAGTGLFGDRGHFEASYEYYNADGIRSQLDRRIGQLVYGEQGAGTAANPFHLVANTRGGTTSFGGLIGSGPLNDQQFVAPGVLAPFIHGAATGTAGIESGGSGAYRERGLIASLRSHQAFGRFDFDVSDKVAFHVQATGTISQNYNIHSPFFIQGLTIASDNAFLPSSIKSALTSVPTFSFSRLYNLTDAPFNSTFSRTVSGYVNAGFEGKIGGFDWSLDYGYGQSKLTVTSQNNINNPRLRAALDAVQGANGIVCRVSVTNPGLYPGCIPLNPFGTSIETAPAVRWIMGDTKFDLTNKMHDLSGTISGSVFNTWAGPVNVAINGEYRRVSFDNRSNSEPSIFANCTGLRFDCTSTTAEYVLARTASGKASQSVAEIAGEVSVPLLRDRALFKALDLTGAVRYTHYTTVGSATTWKLGVDWKLSDELRFRATRSRDIRAPTLSDLFAPATRSLTGFTDLHTNTPGLVTLETVGNPNLKPEIAQTLTIGTVYQPHWLPGLSLAIDYYKINMRDAITSIGGNSAAAQALCEQSNGTSPVCSLYIRPNAFSDRSAANYVTLIRTQNLNLASLKAEGIDVEANYRTKLGAGDFSLRLLASYMPKLESIQFPGATVVNDAGAGTGVPKYKLTMFVGYDIGGFSANVQERWRSSLKPNGNPTLVYSDPRLPSTAYTDLNLSYKLESVPGTPQIFLSVENLFNKQPPAFYLGTNSVPGFAFAAYATDDVVGRYFTAGIRARF